MFTSNILNVTKILSKKEILNTNKELIFISNPQYDLGKFLDQERKSPSPYGEKYLFVK